MADKSEPFTPLNYDENMAYEAGQRAAWDPKTGPGDNPHPLGGQPNGRLYEAWAAGYAVESRRVARRGVD